MLNIPKRVYPQIERESLKRGKKLSFAKGAGYMPRGGTYRARPQRETRAERRAKPSRER